MKDKKYILVATHPRSGTHFLINSLCLNFNNLEFPPIRGVYPTLEGLFYDHDAKYTQEWEKCIENENGKTKIFKTHLTPLEFETALDKENHYFQQREKKIVKHIWKNSQVIYCHRDGRDVMVSWYYFMRKGGGIPGLSPLRLQEASFSEFIRMPNRYLLPIRKFMDCDLNRVSYWQEHVNIWQLKPEIILTNYESLKTNFRETLNDLVQQLGLNSNLGQNLVLPSFKPENNKPLTFRRRLRNKLIRTLKIGISPEAKKGLMKAAFMRKGVVGDWKTHFTAEDKDFFLYYAGKAMENLNYLI